MEPAHAALSPSSAERWISCPASVRMAAKVEDVPSAYAIEGTAAHARGELEASLEFGLITRGMYGARLSEWTDVYAPFIEDLDELLEHVDEYLELIRTRLDSIPNAQLRLEQRMPSGIDGCWGTSDVVIVSPTVIEIIDLKYGKGVPVSAEKNPQLRLYGLGALDTYGDVLGDTEIVRMWVFQPRLRNTSCEELSAAELREWRESIRPIAREALHSDSPRFGPSEEACRWCPVSGQCRAQLEWATGTDFGRDIDLLDPEEIADALDELDRIKLWVSALEETSLRLAYSEGHQIPRYKVVRTNGRRQIVDNEGALEALHQIGYNDDVVATKKPKGITDLERILKKDGHEFSKVLGPFVKKSEGNPTLAPESDKRPAISPNAEAAKEFGTDE